jgi:heme exporter protein D
MRKLLVMACGWCLVAIGIVLTPAPVPIPLIGVLPLLVGCAILTTYSKNFRRMMQRIRHRFGWVSRWLERILHRAPLLVKIMIRRTRPLALLRQARMRQARMRQAQLRERRNPI